MTSLWSDTVERESRYRRRLGAAISVSTVIHLVLLLSLEAPGQWSEIWTAQRIGFEGPELYVGEINPPDFPLDEQERLAIARQAAGAIVEERIEIEPESEAQERILRRIRRGLAGRDLISTPVLELGEDLSVRSTSAPTSRTRDFVILHMVRPTYPPESIRKGVEGLVRVQAWIDREGAVTKVEVLDSAVDLLCENETRRAMRLWKFRPYKLDGKVVEFSVIVPFRYRLE